MCNNTVYKIDPIDLDRLFRIEMFFSNITIKMICRKLKHKREKTKKRRKNDRCLLQIAAFASSSSSAASIGMQGTI